jgi:hypothetical protein
MTPANFSTDGEEPPNRKTRQQLAEEDGMKIKHGIGGSKRLEKRNSTGRQFKLGLLLVGAAALMNPAFSAGARRSETNNGAAITVLVFNFRQAPAQTLAKAEKEAGRILEKVDVPVTWRDCSTGNESCRNGPGRVFILAMMVGPVQNKFADTISGYAVLPAHLAAVYYDYLPRIPGEERDKNDTALVLGCVMAHELGHLLLGAHGHSIAGIMQAYWGIEQTRLALMSQLSFLPEEARLMHADTVPPEAKSNSWSTLAF